MSSNTRTYKQGTSQGARELQFNHNLIIEVNLNLNLNMRG